MADSAKIHLLMIAPDAPPTLSAESIITRRFLWELDKYCTGKVFRAQTMRTGWVYFDKSMTLSLKHLEMHNLSLPLHSFSLKLLRSRYASFLRCPDAEHWLQFMDKQVMKRLSAKPDILYSRFYPFGACMLAYKVKKRLDIPWIMHLSDPWPLLPEKHWLQSRASRQRSACFDAADKISVTTQDQANYFKNIFPQHAEKIFLSPNPIPEASELDEYRKLIQRPTDDKLHIVFAGSLYGKRGFEPLFTAIRILKKTAPSILQHLAIDIYGNLTHNLQQDLSEQSFLHFHGSVDYKTSTIKQMEADVLLTIENKEVVPLGCKHLLLTKVVGYLGIMRPILAITCEGGVTDSLCKEGYGWSVSYENTQALAELLKHLVERRHEIRARHEWKRPPEHLRAEPIVANVVSEMRQLINTTSS